MIAELPCCFLGSQAYCASPSAGLQGTGGTGITWAVDSAATRCRAEMKIRHMAGGFSRSFCHCVLREASCGGLGWATGMVR